MELNLRKNNISRIPGLPIFQTFSIGMNSQIKWIESQEAKLKSFPHTKSYEGHLFRLLF